MICCMTCPWAPTAGGTTVQSSQRNDGVMTPNTQRLHQRLGHINRTLHADIEIPTSLEKKHFIIYKKNNFIVRKTQYCDTQQTIHNTTNNTQHKIHSWVYNFH